MRKIKQLEAFEIAALEDAWKNNEKHHYRNRCKCILMNNEGYGAVAIANFFGVRSRTVYAWLDRWEESGISGLDIRRGRGRKAKLDNLNDEQEALIAAAVSEDSQSLSKVAKEIGTQLGFTVSKCMLTYYLKKKGIHGNG